MTRQTLTETALRETLEDMGLVPKSITPAITMGDSAGFEAWLYSARILYSQLHFLSEMFGTSSIWVQADIGPSDPRDVPVGHQILTIVVPNGST